MHPQDQPPERAAVVMAGSGATATYGELAAGAARFARVLRRAGLAPGDHIALCLENHPRYLELLWGANDAGVLYTACSTRLTAGELAYIVEDCGARVLVVSARYAETAAAVAEAVPAVEHRFSVGGERSGDEGSARGRIPGFQPLEDAVAAESGEPLEPGRPAGADMLYSSGTTGRPKGIYPRAAGEPVGTPFGITPVLQGLFGVDAETVYLSPAPLYHAAPLRFCMGVHQLGGTVVVMERFDARALLEAIARYRVTHAQLVPTMFVRLLRLDPDERRRADLSSLRAVVHAGAPCAPDVKRAMIAWWGPLIHEYYAATEGAGLTWITSEEWLAHPGSVGRPVLGVPHVVDAGGRELGPGETGAIYFSDGPEFAYHNDAAKTAAAYDTRGWATYGDIGHLDADGFLHLTDRASYTIITGGVNVYPQEAEDVLLGHPAVMDAAVFGVPDEEFGEQVKAVVQAVEPPADPATLERALIAHCRERLADVKCPRSVDFRAELPRHETGKLYKRLLVDEYRVAAQRSG